ncbi:tyrosine-type recombinase/integrase [Ancylomarina salipaludis]|nr:site-specific integrase [Ancylomarina salipaludis]
MKKISKGRKSLYLDFYPPVENPNTGNSTRREFLNLHIYERPKSQEDKDHNRATKSLAESIRAKRQIEVQEGTYGFMSATKKKTDFLAYYDKLAQKRIDSPKNYGNWKSAYKYICDFSNNELTVGDLSERLIEDFKEYLMKKTSLANNSQISYFNKFKAAIKQAFKDGLLAENIAQRVESIKEEDTKREFLVVEEIQKLAQVECEIPILKQAFLFSAFTGLRFSDIQKLTWQEIQHSKDNGYFIRFQQKKTKGQETLPIPQNAINFLEKQGNEEGLVFPGLDYSAWNNVKLQNWITKAKINKKITFHAARHSFATLQLTLGTDLYTVSKLLGHKDIRTTQIYAKIIDSKKTEAINKLDDISL